MASWSSPRDWTPGEYPTAEQFDAFISANTQYLYDRIAALEATVAALDSEVGGTSWLGVAGIHGSFPGAISPIEVTTGGAATFDFPSDAATITNTTTRTVAGLVAIRSGGLYLAAHDGFKGTCSLMIKVGAGSTFTGVAPDTAMLFENRTGVTVATAFNGFVEENWLILGPSESVDYYAQLRVHVDAGIGDLTGSPGHEFNWVLVPV